ncbi:DNA gyrase subunit A, partial [Patescibacteria group bacterium]|nr:DNA gyrase subunit A [Patescibacteria group bacterium]
QVLAGQFQSQTTIEELLQTLQGPDFPTGATIYDQKIIEQIYTTGKGSVTMRAKTLMEEDKKGQTRILVHELPYQVNKARLIAKIADLVKNKKLSGIKDLRDESDRKGMQIVIELKKDARPKSVLNNLFKHTELQTNFPANMVALIDGTPQTLNLKQILSEYVKHRQLVIIRRTQYDLKAAKLRAHILEGLIIALDNLDEVIATIKKSSTADTAKVNLMKKFELSDIQAQAILDMQLRRLAALERKKIEDEYQALKITIDKLITLLSTPKKVISTITKELAELKEKYADPRRTRVIKRSLNNFSDEDLEPEEECLITMTKTGYIKRMPTDTYKSQRRGGKGVTGMFTKDEDEVSRMFKANTHDTMLIFSDRGRVFKFKVYEIPQGSRQSKGQAVINLANINVDEKIQSVITIDKNKTEAGYLLMVTKKGTIKKTALKLYSNIRTNGIRAINLKDDDQLVWAKRTSGKYNVMLVSHLGQSIMFKETDARPIGRTASGVKGINLNDQDYVVGMAAFNPGRLKAKGKRKLVNDIFVVMEKGLGKRTAIENFPLQKRGGKGVKVAKLTAKTGNLVSAIMVTEQTKTAILTSKKAQVIKLPMRNIKRIGRTTQGVILMRFNKSADSVAAVALL